MYDDEFPDPDEEFDLVPAESFKKSNNVAGECQLFCRFNSIILFCFNNNIL